MAINLGIAKIPTTYALLKSDGACTDSGTDKMVKILTTGASGTNIDKIVFTSVASADNITSVPTVLLVFYSTVTSGATTLANTFLIGQVTATNILSNKPTVGVPELTLTLDKDFPASGFIYVAQRVAQTTNQQWNCVAYASDY